MIKGLISENFTMEQDNVGMVILTENNGDSIVVCEEYLQELIELIQQYQKHVLKEIPRYPFMDCTDNWITKNGDILNLNEMTKKHLQNCIAMIESICHDENLKPNDYIIYKKLVIELNHRKPKIY